MVRGTRINAAENNYNINGALKKWYPVTISFQGPESDESATNPNPFLDYKLQVVLTSPSGRKYNTPGFFTGDGHGGGAGNVWRICFTPDEIGEWTFCASFHKGKNIAVTLDGGDGESLFPDGCQGSFIIEERDSNAPGFLKSGETGVCPKTLS